MNSGIFVIRPLQNDYTVNEIMYYERYTPNKEEFIAKVTFTADGFNNEYYTIRFIEGEDKYIVFNGWSFPRTISLQTHFRGTYESTHMNLSCISPDGLKVDVSFNENCHTIDPLHFLFTKLWITACTSASELDILNPNKFTSNSIPTNDNLVNMLQSVAYLYKLACSYRENENVNVRIRWALTREYNTRLRILLKLAAKE